MTKKNGPPRRAVFRCCCLAPVRIVRRVVVPVRHAVVVAVAVVSIRDAVVVAVAVVSIRDAVAVAVTARVAVVILVVRVALAAPARLDEDPAAVALFPVRRMVVTAPHFANVPARNPAVFALAPHVVTRGPHVPGSRIRYELTARLGRGDIHIDGGARQKRRRSNRRSGDGGEDPFAIHALPPARKIIRCFKITFSTLRACRPSALWRVSDIRRPPRKRPTGGRRWSTFVGSTAR